MSGPKVISSGSFVGGLLDHQVRMITELREECDALRQRAERAEAENERNLSALYAKEGALVAAQSTIAELTATVERQVGALRTAVLALAHANTELAPGLYDKAYNAVSDELARAALGEP